MKDYYGELETLRILRQDIRHYLSRHKDVSPVITRYAEYFQLMIEGQIVVLQEQRDEEEDNI